MVTNIGDLSDDLLSEILCRLPCEVVFQIKRVSKRWCSLVSGHDFIGRFLRLQSDKRTPKAHGVVDYGGNELFPTKAFERFRNFLSLKKGSQVLAICNDLVLCVEKHKELADVDYYICNPRTMQVVTLPPTPGSNYQRTPWGFTCEPYYKENSNAGLHINAEFRFRVVRIVRPRTTKKYFKINIQVFSNETGKWRKIGVPCPQGFRYFDLTYWGSFGNNGILYWVAKGSLLALRTPLMINNNKMPLVDQYQFHVIEIDLPANHDFYDPAGGYYSCQLHYIGVYGGRVRLQDCNLDDQEPPLLCVWDLKEEDLDQMVLEGTQKLGSEHMKSYSLDQTMMPEVAKSVFYIAYDFNDLDVVYLKVVENGIEDMVKCNIRTGSWSKMAGTSFSDLRGHQFELPWWPTPVPRISR